MITLQEVELRLAHVGLRNRFWGKPEVRELQKIIMDDEVITGAVNGRYEAGFAMLVATDRRILLVDKKLIFLTLEDVRFDMIAEVDFSASLFEASVLIRSINKNLQFSSVRQSELRKLTSYVQQKVMELRQFNSAQIPVVPTLPDTQDSARGYLVSEAANPVALTYTRPALPAYPKSSLTMRHRISRFYPTR